jgi:hypothetical protein
MNAEGLRTNPKPLSISVGIASLASGDISLATFPFSD